MIRIFSSPLPTRVFNLLACLAVCLSLFQQQVSAQGTNDGSVGLGISPVVFELNADPGDTINNQIKIFNNSQSTVSISMGVEDFVPAGEKGEVVLQEPDLSNTTYSIAAWTDISPEEFVLEPGNQQIVNFTINLPLDAEPGGHYGSIVATASGGSDASGTGSTSASKRGALILLRVSGNIEENIQVHTFSTKSFWEKGPVPFELKFENKGNVHLRPAGFITITDIFGNQVAQIEIDQQNVVPNSVRDISTQWDRENLVGRYTATLVANYGNEGKKVLTQVVSFTVFPWKIAVIVLGILVVLGLIYYKLRHRFHLAAKVLMGKHEETK